LKPKAHQEVKLSVFPDPAFIPLVMAFLENSAQAQGLARKEALALTLAGEEVFTYLCRLVSPGQHLEIHSVQGGYYVRTDFIFSARELNLRAFNLTSTVSLEDEAGLNELGLLIASRAVDHFTLTQDQTRVQLSLIKEKAYPRGESGQTPLPQPVETYTIKTPDTAALKWLAQQLGEAYPLPDLPVSFRYPGKLVDMVESQAFQAALAEGPAGEVSGGVFWHWAGERTVECFGPYIFPPGSNPAMAEALINACLASLARTPAVGLINRWSTIDFPRAYFESLGTLLDQEAGGGLKERPHYFRQITEDPGCAVWSAPELEPFLKEEYRRLVLPREIRLVKPWGESRAEFSVLASALDRTRKTVTLRPVLTGADIEENIRQHRRLFHREKIIHCYLELDLAQPWQADFTAPLLLNGFTPRLVIPYGGVGDLVLFQGRNA
jgi:hypothetical protein